VPITVFNDNFSVYLKEKDRSMNGLFRKNDLSLCFGKLFPDQVQSTARLEPLDLLLVVGMI
jgi:hypothetical protein